MAFNWQTAEEYPNNNEAQSSGFDWQNAEEYPESYNNSLAQQNIVTPQSNMPSKNNPLAVQAPVNKQVQNNIVPTQQNVINKQTPFRDAGVEIGRALLPKRAENWWYGTQEDQQMLKQGDANIPTKEQNQELFNNGLISQDEYIQNLQNRTKYDNALADKEYRDIRNANIGKGIFDVGTAAIPIGLAGQVAKNGIILANGARVAKTASAMNKAQKAKYFNQIQKLANKKLATNGKFRLGASVADGTAVGAGFGAFNNIYDNITGLPNENSLPKEIAQGALIGAGFGTGIPIIGAGLKRLANTKFAKDIGNTFAEKFPNFTGSLANILNFNIKNPLANKYKGLDELVAKGNAPVDKRLTQKAKEELKNAEGITPEENKRIINDLEYGLTEERPKAKSNPHSTKTKTEQEAKEWFEEANKREEEAKKASEEKEKADREEFARKMKEMQDAWDKQVKDYQEKKNAEQQNVKPWDTDALPHMTKEEVEQANLKAQQSKWNEKRNVQNEQKNNVEEVVNDDFDKRMMGKYHLFPEEYNKIAKDYEQLYEFAGEDAPSFEEYVKASKNSQKKEFVGENNSLKPSDESVRLMKKYNLTDKELEDLGNLYEYEYGDNDLSPSFEQYIEGRVNPNTTIKINNNTTDSVLKNSPESEKLIKKYNLSDKELEDLGNLYEYQYGDVDLAPSFEQFIEWNKKPTSPTDDLSHVKSETDINTPEQDETRLKNDSDMPDNVTLLPEKIKTKENVFNYNNGIRSVGKDGRVTVYNPDGTIKVRFKKNIKETNKEQPREILESERAEGSDSSYLYQKKMKGKFGTNKIDKDNALIDEYEEGQKLNIIEGKESDLEPTDTKSLQKEIDEWNKKDFEKRSKLDEEHLPDIEENKPQIDGITKKFLKTSGIYKILSDLNPKWSGKMVKAKVKLSNGETIQRQHYVQRYKGLANKLRDEKNILNIQNAIKALTNLKPSVEVRNTLMHLYKQAPTNVQKFIDKQIAEKGLNYKLESGIELKSKRQLEQERKQVRTYLEDEKSGWEKPQGFTPTMQSARKPKVSSTAKVRPYEGELPASNKAEFRDVNTLEEAKVNKTNSELGTTFNDRVENYVKEKELKTSNKQEEKPDWVKNLLRDMDNSESNDNIDLTKKNKFVNADRIYTSHNLNKFADEIADDKNVEDAIKEFVGDEYKFDFKKMPKDCHGRLYADNGTFAINSNDSIERQLGTAKHETHHILFKKIAEACGKKSAEYKMYMEDVKASNLLHKFENNNKAIRDLKNKIDELLSNKNTAKKAKEILGNLDDTTFKKLKEYKNLIKKCNETIFEKEAIQARHGIWKFNGKDISEYYDILRKHVQRTKNGSRQNIRNVKRGIDRVLEGRQEQETIPKSVRNGKRNNKEFLEDKDNEDFDYDIPKAPQSLNEKSQQNRAYRAKLSKLGEKIAIDMGWLTPEQANNRIKQQTLFGKGFYIKQVSDKKDPFIDLYKDPMEGRNSKEGIWGKNTSEEIRHNDSAVESTYAQLKETVNRLHTKKVFDYIEKEFAQKIPDDNRIPEGYIPVNRTLLSAAYFQRFSKDWYKTVTSGEDAIRKTFKDKDMADSWVEIANRSNKEDYMIPKAVFNKLFNGAGELPSQYIERYCKGKGVKGGLKAAAKIAGFAADTFNEKFKRGVLTSMSFFNNNRISNQMLIAAASNPRDYIKSLVDMWKIDRNALSKDNLFNSNSNVIESMIKHPIKFAGDICKAYQQEFSKLPSELVDSSIVEAFEHFSANRARSGYKSLDVFLNLLDGNLIDTKKIYNDGIRQDVINNFLKTAKDEKELKKYQDVVDRTFGNSNKKTMWHNKAVATAGNICFGIPNKIFYKISDEFMKVNTAFENLERKQLMSIKMSEARHELLKKTGRKIVATKELMEYVDKHPEIMSATVKDIEDIIGDYNSFNNFERRILKRAVPFYAWFRTITRNSIMMAKKYPTRFAGILAESHHLKERDKDLKEYQKGSIRTGVKDKRSGKELLINKYAQGIPWNTYGELFDDTQNSKGVGNFSNFYKIPIEAAMGKHFFRDGEITNKRYVRFDENAYKEDAKPSYRYLDTKTGNIINSLPVSTRLGYVGKENLKTLYPIMQSRLANTSGIIQAVKKAKETGEFLEPDKQFDADFGGFYNGDYAGTIKNKKGKGKELTRFASNDFSEKVKLFNRLGGLSVQNKQPLNKKEIKALKEKYQRQRKRMR